MDAEPKTLTDTLGRSFAEGAPDLYELLTAPVHGSVAAPSLVPRRLNRVFARYQGNSIEGPLAVKAVRRDDAPEAASGVSVCSASSWPISRSIGWRRTAVMASPRPGRPT
ncbi:hypothetical protein [Streptomyces sp. SM11]|uniref:hypothetical protein n=1 Tax=Streptomyces sp. SM11 TaxID=565557 RepID=UPI000CD507FB|nr:hypothetical protein [Streptomyces sp. SM11]